MSQRVCFVFSLFTLVFVFLMLMFCSPVNNEQDIDESLRIISVDSISSFVGKEISFYFGIDTVYKLPVEYQIIKGPDGAVLDKNSGYFKWFPERFQVGEHKITVSAAGARSTDTISFIAQISLPFMVEDIDTQEIYAERLIKISVPIEKKTNDVLRFSIIENLTGIDVNRQSGVISWLPDSSHIGIHRLLIQVASDSYVDTGVVTVIVHPQYRISSVKSVAVYPGDTVSVDFDATPSINGKNRFYLENQPSGSEIDSISGKFYWITPENTVGHYSLKIVSTDSVFYDATELTINLNAPFTINVKKDYEIFSGQLFTLNLSEYTQSEKNVVYSAVGNVPNVILDSMSGKFTWSPQVSDTEQTFSIIAKVQSFRDTINFTVRILPPFELVNPTDVKINAGDEYRLHLLHSKNTSASILYKRLDFAKGIKGHIDSSNILVINVDSCFQNAQILSIEASCFDYKDTLNLNVLCTSIPENCLKIESPKSGQIYNYGDTMSIVWTMDARVMDEAVVSFKNYGGDFSDLTPMSNEWFKIPRDIGARGYKSVVVIDSANNIVRCTYKLSLKDTLVFDSFIKFNSQMIVKIWDPYPNESYPECMDGDTVQYSVIRKDSLKQNQDFKINVATVDDIKTLFGTSKVKLVFNLRDSGLCFVDYTTISSGYPKIKKLPGAADGTFPVISPDGNYVTYATGTSDEYSKTPSTAWIQPLSASGSRVKVADGAHVPRFIQNASVPTVLYATCASNSVAAKYTFEGCGKMLKAEFNGSSFGTPIEVYGGGSFLGGLSYDNNNFAHGEQNKFAFMFSLKDQAAGVKLLHCFGDASPQVCQTSISSSVLYPNTMLYFDFGLSSAPAGVSAWTPHKKIFVGKYDGSIVKSYDLPTDIPTPFNQTLIDEQIGDIEYSFPEWSNHPYYAVSSVLTKRKYKEGSYKTYSINEFVYGINLKDNTKQKLAWSTDTSRTTKVSMSFPWLWIERPINFQEQPGWLDQTWYKPLSDCTLEHSN